MDKVLEFDEYATRESLPHVDEVIRLPSGQVKRFGDCTKEDVESVIEMIRMANQINDEVG